MRNRLNNGARPADWKVAAAKFITALWKAHNDGSYVFIGTKDDTDHRWKEHVFKLPVRNKNFLSFSESLIAKISISISARTLSKRMHAKRYLYANALRLCRRGRRTYQQV